MYALIDCKERFLPSKQNNKAWKARKIFNHNLDSFWDNILFFLQPFKKNDGIFVVGMVFPPEKFRLLN